MFEELKTRELVIIICVAIGIWFGGLLHGNRATTEALKNYYLQAIEQQNIEHRIQLGACSDDFLGMTKIFAVAVHDIVNMKCPDIAAQLQKIPELEHLQ